MNRLNEFSQAIGEAINWQEPPYPAAKVLEGRFVRLEPLTIDHVSDLFAANSLDDGRMWTYMPYGPFETLKTYEAWLESAINKQDPQFYAIVDLKTQQAVGVASYLRILPLSGSIEVGHIAYSPLLQKTPLATEAMFLLMQNAFELGYRRYEWKCDALNAPSRSAAERLGFRFEGIFRQATHYKGRNRDTAWFALTDKDWTQLKQVFERWLSAENLTEGQQKLSLRDLTKTLL